MVVGSCSSLVGCFCDRVNVIGGIGEFPIVVGVTSVVVGVELVRVVLK